MQECQCSTLKFNNIKLKGINVIAGLLGVFLISLSLSSCFAQNIKGNGDVVSEERRIGSFEVIEVGGAFEVMLRQGSSKSCVVEADANLMEYIVTRVQRNTLKVYQEKGFKDAESLKLYITFVDLEGIEISGAAEIKGEETFTLDELNIVASGASSVDYKGEPSLTINVSGAADVDGH